MLTSINELVFLQSIGVPIQMHRSQFYEFSKAMYEHGYFEKYKDENDRLFYTPKNNSFSFTRKYYRNKKEGKITNYTWYPQRKHPSKSHEYTIGIDLSSHSGDSAVHTQIPV